ncbi:transcriptional regulator [Parashewanella spongiae]|uniref:helix-turn-helix domain-containing protein n=1 Tax=Parashewanella spongiae TaxID=342950 RepID=UPI001FB24C82|nr:transcriptional regulator [Parashewanella spongiae]MCL1078846.1 transcriptional regulator [Parashewanella spongiae]
MASSQRHRNATTTPEMRRFIQTSSMSVTELSKILNISQATVRKWRNRESTNDGNHTPHHLNTTLTPIEEYVVVGLRSQHQLSLDRLLKATQEFINPNVSRSGLARCLKRYGVSKIDDCDVQEIPEPFFNELPIVQDSGINTYTLNPETLANTLKLPDSDGETVVQVMSLAIPEALTQAKPSSVFIGIDTQSDWVYVDIYQDSNTQAANRYIGYVLSRGPFHLRKLLVRNYHLFLTRFPGVQTNITPKINRTKSAPKLEQARRLPGDSV